MISPILMTPPSSPTTGATTLHYDLSPQPYFFVGRVLQIKPQTIIILENVNTLPEVNKRFVSVAYI